WAKDRPQVSAARGVLWPGLATRPAAGEHVISKWEMTFSTDRMAKLGRRLVRDLCNSKKRVSEK
ncbi:hypothetical protein EFQ08_07470, partial [Limosilactobacillus fermentum]|nr:hypothetical protein [Limosilactobacillus fermentum]